MTTHMGHTIVKLSSINGATLRKACKEHVIKCNCTGNHAPVTGTQQCCYAAEVGMALLVFLRTSSVSHKTLLLQN
uniref:Uncharacterized protein n=1 Tax=Pararge aegeria TaxID=116150 RepID=S4NGT3_9NEOP